MLAGIHRPRYHHVTSMAITAATPIARNPCTRPARRIIRRCGLGPVFWRAVSARMVAHSGSDGRWRFSGLLSQIAARSASRSSARPRRVSRCLRVSQSRSEWTR